VKGGDEEGAWERGETPPQELMAPCSEKLKPISQEVLLAPQASSNIEAVKPVIAAVENPQAAHLEVIDLTNSDDDSSPSRPKHPANPDYFAEQVGIKLEPNHSTSALEEAISVKQEPGTKRKAADTESIDSPEMLRLKEGDEQEEKELKAAQDTLKAAEAQMQAAEDVAERIKKLNQRKAKISEMKARSCPLLVLSGSDQGGVKEEPEVFREL